MVTEVFTASSGHEAIEQCLHSEFDLIFMDIQMPNLDGVATMKAIRQNATNAKTPIIAVTALVIASEQAKFISEGMNEVLAKPLDENELKNIVKKYCSHEEPKKEAQVLENKSNEETSSKTPTENKTNPTSIWNKELILKQCANKKDLAIDMIKMFASTIPDTNRFGITLVYKLPGPKIIKSASAIAAKTSGKALQTSGSVNNLLILL